MRITSVAAALPLPLPGRGAAFCLHPARRAFTLVELLVAMAVSLLLVFVLLKVFTTATTSWQRGEAQADAYREARGALQFMARDLSTTIQPITTDLDAKTSYASPLLPTLAFRHYPNPEPTHAYSEEDTINDEVYCLTSIVNSATPVAASSTPSSSTPAVVSMPSEMCAVGYFCQWMPAIAAPGAAQTRAPRAFALMRQFLNSDGVFKRIQAGPRGSSPLDFSVLYTRDSLAPGTVPSHDPPTSSSTQLAAYLWDLKFRIDTNLIDATTGTASPPVDHNVPPRVYDGSTIPYPGVLPPYVEIRFKALSTGAGRRLEGNTAVEPRDWKDTNSSVYKQFILPSARQFVLRVPLLNSNPPPHQTPTP